MLRDHRVLTRILGFGAANRSILKCVGGFDKLMTADDVMKQTGWTREDVHAALLHRVSPADPDDAEHTPGMTKILENGQVVYFEEAGLCQIATREACPRAKTISFMLDVLSHDNSIGLEVKMSTHVNSGDGGASITAGNIFDGRSFPLCALSGLGYNEHGVPQLVLPKIQTPQQLAYYGFLLLKAGEPFEVYAPTGLAPVIPLKWGAHYHARGGNFLESHGNDGPLHFWVSQRGFLLWICGCW